MEVEASLRDPLSGLTGREVADRVEAGRLNVIPEGPSRTTKAIFRDNIFTRFNLILSVLLVIILFVAPIQDALFGAVMVINAAIGIIQELRAKRTLDRLALLSTPGTIAVRDGRPVEISIADIVLDDVLMLAPGDQVVVDGEVLESRGLEINESLLTGESDPVSKHMGDSCRSGSFVVAGSGRMQATRVGSESYAAKLASEAKLFTITSSELRDGIDWILLAVSWALIPTGALLVWSQMSIDVGFRRAAQGTVAGLVAMVPQGLVLLTSMAFAVAVVRLGRRNVLVQELPAVEGLARVDVVCLDKTGTLTEGHLRVLDVKVYDKAVDVGLVLAATAAADSTPNATIQAIGTQFSERPDWPVLKTVPFSSDRKWSAAAFTGRGTWILGAPEVVAATDMEILRAADRYASDGNRVLALVGTDDALAGDVLPANMRPVALVVLGDRIRPDAVETLDFFARQNVAVKVISGDHPATVAAIAARVGVPSPGNVVDGRELPADPDRLADVMERGTVFGRVHPHQKRAMIKALQRRGHTVAMTGDGVNDVLALKVADIGVAMGNGSGASRAVAQVVLLDSAFSSLPEVVAEGRRVIANIERVANLFVTKTIYAVLLSVAVAIALLPFPFLPRHLTLVGSITIGIPGFFLALEPTARRAQRGFVGRVMRFAVPVGAVAALSTFAAYGLAQIEDVGLVESRTMATLVLVAVGLFALTVVCRPLTTSRKWLIWSMAGLFGITLLWGSLREFYGLDLPRAIVVFAAIGIASLTGTLMYLALVGSRWLQSAPDLMRQAPELLAHAPEVIRQPLVAAGGWRVARWMSLRAGGRPRPGPVAVKKPRRRSPAPIELPDWVTPDGAESSESGDGRSQLELPLE
ncbi:MAG: HAD-IC family P-type ATPase [Acidimicrobiia bacterium]|nr:HAD-IC family P-type ATPase [Acidimicrobiia bacterium]